MLQGGDFTSGDVSIYTRLPPTLRVTDLETIPPALLIVLLFFLLLPYLISNLHRALAANPSTAISSPTKTSIASMTDLICSRKYSLHVPPSMLRFNIYLFSITHSPHQYGQLRPQHQRLAILHHHRPNASSQRQAHRLRRGDRRAGVHPGY